MRPWLLALALLACAKQGWREVRSQEGGFTIALPGEAQRKKEVIASDLGPIDFEVYAWAPGDRYTIYTVGYTDFPEGLLEQRAPRQLLDSVARALTKAGSIVDEKPIELELYSGREVTLRMPRGMISRTRLYLVGRRVYQLLAVVAAADQADPGIDRFFGSFRLTETRRR